MIEQRFWSSWLKVLLQTRSTVSFGFSLFCVVGCNRNQRKGSAIRWSYLELPCEAINTPAQPRSQNCLDLEASSFPEAPSSLSSTTHHCCNTSDSRIQVAIPTTPNSPRIGKTRLCFNESAALSAKTSSHGLTEVKISEWSRSLHPKSAIIRSSPCLGLPENADVY